MAAEVVRHKHSIFLFYKENKGHYTVIAGIANVALVA